MRGSSRPALLAGLLFVLSRVALAGTNVWTSGGPAGTSVQSIAIDPATPSTLYAGTESGVFRSTDAGGSWTDASAGLPGLGVNTLALNPSTPSTLYAGGDGGVYKSTDAGGSWSAAGVGLGSLSVYALAVDPSAPATLYAGTYGGGVFRSVDAGGNWVSSANGLTNLQVEDVAIDPATPSVLYAGTWGNGVFKSTDSGNSWSPAGTEIASVRAHKLAIDSSSPWIVYAGTLGGVFRSTDAGASWAAASGGLTQLHIGGLVIHPATSSTLHAATYYGGGVFESTDSGGTWAPADAGLPAADVFALALDRSGTRTLYAGLGGGGVWQFTPPAVPPTAIVSGDATICSGASTSLRAALTGVAPWSVAWSDGAIQGGLTASPAIRSVSPASTAVYTVKAVSDALTTGTSGGSATVTVAGALPSAVIAVPGKVDPGSTGNTASVPDAGAGATYSWNLTNGTITAGGGTRTISWTAGSAGTASFSVTVTAAAGCSSTGHASCAVGDPPTALVSGGGSICTGRIATIQATLTGQPPWSLTWSDGVVQGDETASPVSRSVSPASTTVYTVTAVSDANLDGTSSGNATVTVTGPLPSASITTPGLVAPGSTGNTASVPDAGAGATYSWTLTNGTITSGAGTTDITWTAGTAGDVLLSVTVTSSGGCANTGYASSRPGTAAAPCTLVGAPSQFAPPGGQTSYGPAGKFKQGYTQSFDLFTYQGLRKLVVRENYGYSIYDLSSPGSPIYQESCDIESVYPRLGDVYNTVVSVGAAADGTRILVSYREPHGSLLMARTNSTPAGCTFKFAGEFNPPRGGGEFIVPQGGRYLGLALLTQGSAGAAVADVTAYQGEPAAESPGSIPSEGISSAPLSVGDASMLAGNYVVYPSVSSPTVGVVDLTNAGPAGSISDGIATYTFTVQDVGFPAGDNVLSVAAAMHPNGRLYILVEGTSAATQQSDGYALVTMPSPGVFAQVGQRFVPPSTWIELGGTTAIATAGDVLFFAWGRDAGATWQKLQTFSANGWGADQSPTAVVSWIGNPVFNRALSTGPGSFELYSGTKQYGYATAITCTDGTPPVISDCHVSPSAGPPGTQVAIGCTVVDGASGVRSVDATIRNALGGSFGTTSMTASGGSVYSGALGSASLPAGAYSVDVSAVDSSSQANGQTAPGVAAFTIQGPHTLTVAKSGSGTVTSAPAGISCGRSCSTSLAYGTTVTLTAAAAAGSVFAGWGGDCTGAGSSCPLTMDRERHVVAAFALRGFYTLAPCRLFDTRNSTGPDSAAPILSANETRLLSAAGRCGLPSSAASLAVNVTTTASASDGSLTLFRGDLDSPPASSNNVFRGGKTRAETSLLELARDGSQTFKVLDSSPGAVHFILDVNGYFQ